MFLTTGTSAFSGSFGGRWGGGVFLTTGTTSLTGGFGGRSGGGVVLDHRHYRPHRLSRRKIGRRRGFDHRHYGIGWGFRRTFGTGVGVGSAFKVNARARPEPAIRNAMFSFIGIDAPNSARSAARFHESAELAQAEPNRFTLSSFFVLGQSMKMDVRCLSVEHLAGEAVASGQGTSSSRGRGRGRVGECSGGDLNPHALRHTPLKRTCLPFHHPSDPAKFNQERRKARRGGPKSA